MEPGATRAFRVGQGFTARCPWESNRSRSVGDLRKASAKMATQWAPINQLSLGVSAPKEGGDTSCLRMMQGSSGWKRFILPKIVTPSSRAHSTGPSPLESPCASLLKSPARSKNLKESLLAAVLDLPQTPKQMKSPAASWTCSACMPPMFSGGSTVDDLVLRFGEGVVAEGERTRAQQIFSRFVTAGTSDVDRKHLHDMLNDLGYVLVTVDDVNRMASRISAFPILDSYEFGELLEECALFESRAIKSLFETYAGDAQNLVDVRTLSVLLRDCGSPALNAQVREALSVVGLAGRTHYSFDDFVRMLAARHAADGFSRAEIQKAIQVFDRLAAPRIGCPSVLELQPGEFAVDGLTNICGLHAMHAGRSLAQRMGAISGERGLRLHEFLALARRLRSAELVELQIAYDRANREHNGRLTVEEFEHLLQELGFTILDSARNEVLRKVGLMELTPTLSFDEVARFVAECRRTFGFDHAERIELENLFHRYDTQSSGKMQTMQMLDLLRFMGHSHRVDDMHRLIREFDANANGTIELQEYMHLMRMHREAELSDARRIFKTYQNGSNQMHLENLVDALGEMGHEIELENLAFPNGMPEMLSFDAFARVSDQGRKHATILQHKRAGFSPSELALIGEVYDELKGTAFTVGKGELLRLLADYDVPVTTSEGRQHIFGLLEHAKMSSSASGNEEEDGGEMGSSAVGFWTFVHLLRLIAREAEVSRAAREDSAISETCFSPTEVASFRDVFMECCASLANPDTSSPAGSLTAPLRASLSSTAPLAGALSRNRRAAPRSSVPVSSTAIRCTTGMLAAVLGLDHTRTHLPIVALHALLKSIGLRPAADQVSALQAKIGELREANGGLDFAGFLLLMRWMLDNNFASVLAVEAHSVRIPESSRTSSPRRARRATTVF